MATHHLDDTQPHAFWDNSYPARLRILPGDTVVFETVQFGYWLVALPARGPLLSRAGA